MIVYNTADLKRRLMENVERYDQGTEPLFILAELLDLVPHSMVMVAHHLSVIKQVSRLSSGDELAAVTWALGVVKKKIKGDYSSVKIEKIG